MKKRVHLHQLRVGMYVDELEVTDRKKRPTRRSFTIRSIEEIEHLMDCNAMSVVIDIAKGTDIDGQHPSAASIAAKHTADLQKNYSEQEIALARHTIATTVPNILQLMDKVHGQGAIDMDVASEAVHDIMDGTEDNAGALINVAKLKTKEEGTFLHSLSVSALLITFGRTLGFPEQAVKSLGIGGLVHDIGKMAIPARILHKTTKLTPEEFNFIRAHPTLGHDMLSQIGAANQTVRDICLYHHEKFDGSGYPFRLAGEAIPMVARLAAICDVYDALTTIRSYKAPWTQAEAIKLMLNAPGHFDPHLLKMFVSKMIVSGKVT
ncbi:HD-GYP domain-containing protein [Agrobacterium genomosp. 3]|uniref:HD-GYP domain-containing protein n=1 Tax=Agrobacterium tomkonis TaxID=1183410 RepID=UPI001CD900CF|nr:HD-GYP domain-containing protein [Agrobacterium tomkonis]MCA1895100.1 HD-GYP domain-containing protein [Agrobacterium tomkonis]